jgi:hypothetical protein
MALPASLIAAGTLGAVLGLSQLVHGAYDESVWAPIALGMLVLLLAVIIGAPQRIPLVGPIALFGLAMWSLISSAWGDSADSARIAAERWLLYAAVLALLLRLIAGEARRAESLLAGAGAGILAVAAWIEFELIRRHGASLFLGSRLNDPLGYINGQAGYLLVGVWPCLAFAERRRPAALAGLGLGGVVLLVGIGALTLSRSWELGLTVATVIVCLAFPGRRRRLAAILIAAAAIYAIYGRLSAVSHPAAATASATHRAGVAILIASLATAAVWALSVWLLERLASVGTRARDTARWLASVGLGALAVIAVVIVAVHAGRIAHTVRTQYDAFVHLAPSQGSVRLFSGAGNRYDYWRVAWIEFKGEPLRGVGAGNYQPGYYLHRRTDESITQPHSLEMQTLAELGLVGAGLLGCFLVAVAMGGWRLARRAPPEGPVRAVAVAASGAFVGWFAQTSVDWEHLIPGLTGIALVGAAALLALGRKEPVRLSLSALSRPVRLGLVTGIAVVTCAAAVLIGIRILSLNAASDAQHALAHSAPRATIVDATRALEYDPESVQALVSRAAGFAQFDAFSMARADLERAVRLEPHNWVNWALLGDLLTRRGKRAAAESAYRHALALNPLEPELQAAVTHDRPRR